MPHHRIYLLLGTVMCLLGNTGCRVIQQSGMYSPVDLYDAGLCDAGLCDAGLCESGICQCGSAIEVPRELDKVTVPLYRVEPPDILSIDVVQQVAQSSYALDVGDSILLTVMGTFPEEPIAGEYQIEAGGVIELGFAYGAVEVAGRTLAEAANLIEQHLRTQLREPRVSMSLRNVASMQRISGEHLVGMDGTITLGQYGSVSVVGMTLDEVRLAIVDHLAPYFANPKVSVSVYAFNSKTYYIVTQGGGQGDSLVRLPFT